MGSVLLLHDVGEGRTGLHSTGSSGVLVFAHWRRCSHCFSPLMSTSLSFMMVILDCAQGPSQMSTSTFGTVPLKDATWTPHGCTNSSLTVPFSTKEESHESFITRENLTCVPWMSSVSQKGLVSLLSLPEPHSSLLFSFQPSSSGSFCPPSRPLVH